MQCIELHFQEHFYNTCKDLPEGVDIPHEQQSLIAVLLFAWMQSLLKHCEPKTKFCKHYVFKKSNPSNDFLTYFSRIFEVPHNYSSNLLF